jgi:hypothetical protein
MPLLYLGLWWRCCKTLSLSLLCKQRRAALVESPVLVCAPYRKPFCIRVSASALARQLLTATLHYTNASPRVHGDALWFVRYFATCEGSLSAVVGIVITLADKTSPWESFPPRETDGTFTLHQVLLGNKLSEA